MSSRRSLLTICTVISHTCLSGCFSASLSPPRTVPVHGSVTFKGKPVPGVRVTFHPQFDIGSVKFVPYGETGADGTFQLNTGAVGNGAPRGDYIVTLEMPRIEPDPKDGLESEVDRFKGAYRDPAKSDWKVTLEDGDNLLDPFQLK